MVQAVARREVRLRGDLCITVPWTYQLAIITAEDAIAHQRAQFLWDRPAIFDGEIRDAASRVETIRADDGLGRTDFDAGIAFSALVFGQWCRVGQQAQIGVDFAEEEPRAGIAIEQQGVFADPAQMCIACQRFFQGGRAVGENAIAVGADGFLDAPGQLLQARAHQLVIIAPQCIAGNVGQFAIMQHLLGALGVGTIVESS